MPAHTIPLFIFLFAFSPFVYCSGLLTSGPLDKDIKRASLVYLPLIDWRLYKAQLYQESHLNPLAVSHAGAKGVAQFMPGTWGEYQTAFKTTAQAFNAGHSIRAGAWYMSKMRRFWKSPRPEHDRHSLALTSYNWGAGNVNKEQKKCEGALLYKDIAKCMKVKEAKEYAPRIWRHYLALLLGG